MARKPSRSLQRRVGSRPERRTILILCEGKESEPDYINALRRLPEIRAQRAVKIEVYPRRGVPFELVLMATEIHDDEIDEIWCVFDVEWPINHPNLERALELAGQHGIRTAISNPCFELWLLLHHGDENAFLTTDEADRKSRARDRRQGKNIDGDWYVARRQVAAERAMKLAKRHAREGRCFPRNNPSSSVCDLVRSIDPPPDTDPTSG